ncbi:FUSC family protein [Salinisphaera sp. Q1T1-3]|uniref:FUSC family protein n=1 Tax=Salinisphaera sp. Q1T1-3 TaxID=2321229 RepID=UPI000E71FFB6|nr:FUSC family protein [Salinisphaera sp. Q1T1-3]RJS92948.1 FUSC family protein [Salinisphaera sp. Q1T1-3]
MPLGPDALLPLSMRDIGGYLGVWHGAWLAHARRFGDNTGMSRLAWLFAPNGEAISFAIRCVISVGLSLWLAFWLELDNAYWAFINVAILIQPLPGFLVVRGFARLLGTFVAACVAILLVALFAQTFTLFSIAMIAWVAAMVFCASLFQNNLSYGFVLAGYVTVIIGVRVMSGDPGEVFSVAVARALETGLAAVVAAFVSVLLAPSVTARKYLQARIAALKAIGGQYRVLDRSAEELKDEDGNPNTPHPQLHALVEKTLSLEQTRQYARFDAPEFGAYDRLARRLDYELLSIVSAMASLQVYLARLGTRADRAPLKRLDKAAALLESDPSRTEEITAAFDTAYDDVLAEIGAGAEEADRKRSITEWVVISRALDLANRLRAAVTKHGLLLAEQGGGPRPSRRSEFSTARTLGESFKVTIRATAAMSAGAILWATHDQQALSGTMVLLSVLTTLFALMDNPTQGAVGFGIGGLLAGVAAFFVNFVFLPHADSFAMLMLVLSPCVFVAGLAMINPSTALMGRVGLVQFALFVHPANGSRQDFVAFLQSFLGAELAVILALLAFALVLPVDNRRLLKDRLAAIFGELSRGFAEPRERFETRIYSRLLKLPVAADKGEFHVSARQAAFAAVNMGVEARSLIVLADRAGFSRDRRAAIRENLLGIESLFEHGYPAISDVLRAQSRINRLAGDLLGEAVAFKASKRRRYAIRAAVSGELVAAALADYALARENSDENKITLGEADCAT